jgi:hypothetical protein
MRLPFVRVRIEWMPVPRPDLKSLLRPTIARTMVLVAFVATVIGFWLWVVRPVEPITEPAPPKMVNVDHEIYDIVLSDLIENKEFNDSIGRPVPKLTKVVFIPRSAGHVTLESLGFFSSHMMQGGKIGPDVQASLAERNPRDRVFSIDDYRPSHPDILVGSIDQFNGGRYPAACGYVIPYLPGYSKDGQTAFFRFSIPPLGYHPGFGLYLLKRIKGRWEIVEREIDVYL